MRLKPYDSLIQLEYHCGIGSYGFYTGIIFAYAPSISQNVTPGAVKQ